MKEEKKKALTEFHRNTIQKAAEKLFLERGVVATSLDEIANESGYSKATIYAYFKNKADIWNNVLLSAMKTLKLAIENVVLSDVGSLEKYYALCEAMSDYFEENPLYFESLLGTIPLEDDEVSQQIYKTGDEVTEIIGMLIRQGVSENVMRSDLHIANTTMLLWASISGIIRMANQKKLYISEITGNNKNEFLHYSFETLFRSIARIS